MNTTRRGLLGPMTKVGIGAVIGGWWIVDRLQGASAAIDSQPSTGLEQPTTELRPGLFNPRDVLWRYAYIKPLEHFEPTSPVFVKRMVRRGNALEVVYAEHTDMSKLVSALGVRRATRPGF